MNPLEVPKQLKGVFGFPVTPFRDDLSLDLDALASNVEEMVRHPFCAIVAAGGTGELYSMSPSEIEDVVRVTVEATSGKMPVVAGTGFNTPIGVDITRRVEKAGASLILALPPYYSNSPEAGLFDYYAEIGKATSLPIMVYSRDWASFTPDQVSRLCDRIPNLLAWKDGQADMKKYQRIMFKVGDRLAWYGGQGDDCVPGYFAIGVQAYTSSISNIAPKVSLALAEAGMARDFATLDVLMKKYVHPIYAFRERGKGYEVAAMKTAMELIGMKAGPVRPPLNNIKDSEVADLRKIMEAYSEMLDSRTVAAG